MNNKKVPQQKFKAGDVVVHKSDGAKGIVYDLAGIPIYGDDGVEKRIRDIEAGKLYRVRWFDHQISDRITLGISKASILKLCEGLSNVALCDNCEFRYKCWTDKRDGKAW